MGVAPVLYRISNLEDNKHTNKTTKGRGFELQKILARSAD